MSLKSILNFFQPKDKTFYSLFEQVTTTLSQMGATFHEAIHETDYQKRVALLKSLEDLEHKNDEVTHQIFIELGRNFITPFDREDIHYLATSLDDIADYIYASAKKINFYKVNPNDTGIHKLAELILQGTAETKKAVMGLRNMRNIKEMTEAMIKVNSIENQADDVFDMSIEKLFEQENDFKEVIKKREIYQVLEIATDKIEDVSNVIESIIIKYA
jgi:predicted phosphate transport protein (TIGR00153 family)